MQAMSYPVTKPEEPVHHTVVKTEESNLENSEKVIVKDHAGDNKDKKHI